MENFFLSKHCPELTPTAKQVGVQAKVISHLKQHGRITAYEIQQLGTTDARKMITRLRRMGVVTDTTTEPNAHGKGSHAVYHYKKGQ